MQNISYLKFKRDSYLKLKFLFKNESVRYKSKLNQADYSKTLNLPNSGKFELSMKNICENEEKIKNLAKFDDLYKWQKKNRSSRPVFTLHDGPPYANGDIHIGHMVNKVLKDIYLRFKLLSGYQVNYKPGWDCHGLPIELNAIKSLKKSSKTTKLSLNKSDPIDIRANASQYANSCINIQMNSFKSMNLLADWSSYYRTIDSGFMCGELDLFYRLYENKLIYREYMPVYWSFSSQTALAEFELEYNASHKSDAFYVAFEMIQYSNEIKKFLKPDQKLYAPIWTTTPWSLPCNKAIAFNPNLKYGLLRVNNTNVYLIENELINTIRETIPYFKDSTRLDCLIDGTLLNNSFYKSIFTEDSSKKFPLLPGEHVGNKQGTGLVHTAPSLGQDDFKLAKKYNLPTKCVIDELGRYTADDEILNKYDLNGLLVLDPSTTTKIKNALGESILHHHSYVHSYPYDWRTKKPCIIRSSMQWFIDTNRIKEEALNALKQVKIRPSNVSNSMNTTLSNRPYWCISRQRSWGLPIPCLFDSNDSEKKNPLINKDLIEKIKGFIKKDGNVDFWWCGKYDKELAESQNLKETSFSKSKDILDIWFDSGSSFNSVLESNDKTADLYCEGVDQFSGWFQSSLLLSVALNKQSPYKSILVHGFVVDEQNRKMSKSVGNVIEPAQAIKGIKGKLPQSGLDTLRFWIAHEYYKPQIQIGSQILDKFLKRVFEIRSILRFLVGNLYDLNNINKQLVAYDSLLPIDKYILHKLNETLELVVDSYNDMSLNKSVNLIESFFLTQLSSFYIKSIRDRLYCDPSNSLERKSAQTAIYHTLVKSLVMIGPIMPHLAEEAYLYSVLKSNDKDFGLFRSEFNYDLNKEWSNSSINNLFEIIFMLRNKFFDSIKTDNPAIYDIKLECNTRELYDLLKNYNKLHNHSNAWLIECFGCANLSISCEPKSQTNEHNFRLDINKTNKFMCQRCRKYNAAGENCLCPRCEKLV